MKKNTEGKILESAKEIFQTKGFAGAKMQEIADNAGINKGLLHYYFKSKERLFEYVFNIAAKHMLGKLNDILKEDIELFPKIEKLIGNYISFLSKNTTIPNFIFQEINKNPDFFQERTKTLSSLDGVIFFKNQIKKSVDKGEITDIDANQLIINIISISIFPFVAKPMIKGVLEISEVEFEAIIEDRKKTAVEFVIKSITNFQ